ncbi:hypothetical protein Godav_018860, partial [Gossypium davidsonii]|nr:hypothetical protein [Gossypium davidsonii]
KTVVHFKSVAKSWDCLVDDPDFAKLHLDHSLTTNTYLKLFLDNCLEHDDKAYSVDFDSLNNLVQFPRPLTAETKNIWFLQWFTCCLSAKFALDLGTEEYYEIKKGDTSFKVKKCESDCSHFEYMNAVLGGCLCVSRDHLTCPVEDHINLWVMKQYGVKESCTELLYLSRDQWLTSIFHTTAVGIEYFLMMAEVVSQLGSIWGMKQGKPCVLQVSATFLDVSVQ